MRRFLTLAESADVETVQYFTLLLCNLASAPMAQIVILQVYLPFLESFFRFGTFFQQPALLAAVCPLALPWKRAADSSSSAASASNEVSLDALLRRMSDSVSLLPAEVLVDMSVFLFEFHCVFCFRSDRYMQASVDDVDSFDASR